MGKQPLKFRMWVSSNGESFDLTLLTHPMSAVDKIANGP